MIPNTDSDSTTTNPLLKLSHGGERERERERENEKWWNKLVNTEETKKQLMFSLPMILTNVFYYAIPLVSVMFAGHLGATEFAGATLANSWVTVSGFAPMIGLSGALETLCGQGYGAKRYRTLGIYLQSSCIISFIFSIFISALWFFTEPIMVLLQQEPRIAEAAGVYTKFIFPAVFAYGFLQNTVRFVQAQSAVGALVALSALPAVVQVGVGYGLVKGMGLGLRGASMAACVSLWIGLLVLVVHVGKGKRYEATWEGFSGESFGYVFSCLKLALPSAAMVCLEYWAFEILVILAGLAPNSETTTSLIAMCVNTEAIAYMITYGLGAAASTRVSNELGAGNPEKAKQAMTVTVELSIFLALGVVLLLGFGHDIWAGLFTDSLELKQEFASMTPLLAISITADSVQGVLSGVARGCGWQHLAACVNLATFYAIGLPIGVFLGFKLKLYVKGLWIGLICGLAVQTFALLFIVLRSKWTEIDLSDHHEQQYEVLA